MNAYQEYLRWCEMARIEGNGRWSTEVHMDDRHVWRIITVLSDTGPHVSLERLEGWERGVPNEWVPNAQNISLDQIAFWAGAKAAANAAQE